MSGVTGVQIDDDKNSFQNDLESNSARNVTGSFPPFGLSVQLGRVTGWTSELVVGHNLNIGANDTEDIWDGSIDYVFPTSAATLSTVSTDAADTSAGTGARTLLLEGLNGSHLEISETITMNGVTPVVSSNSYLRLNKATVITAGTGGENAGEITLTHGVDDLGIIQVGQNRTLNSIFTIPAAKEGFIFSFGGDTGPNLVAPGQRLGEIFLEVRPDTGVFTIQDVVLLSNDGTGAIDIPVAFPIFVDEKSDIKMSFLAHKNNSKATGRFSLGIKVK